MSTRPDFGNTAADYSRHRQGFPGQLYDMLESFGLRFDGTRAVDLGTGTGTLARGMARRGARVTGVDPSASMTNEASRLDLEWGVNTQYINATAERTGLESDAFDLVTSGQSWWWFNRRAALSEAMRILRPGGSLAICSFDWLPLPGSVVETTERLIMDHNPDWNMHGGDGTHPDFITDLEAGGFEEVRSGHMKIDARYTKEAWRGRVRASAGVGASLSEAQVQAFDQDLKKALDGYTVEKVLAVPHMIYAAVGSKPNTTLANDVTSKTA